MPGDRETGQTAALAGVRFEAVLPVRRGAILEPEVLCRELSELVAESGAAVSLLTSEHGAPRRRRMLGFGSAPPAPIRCDIGGLGLEILQYATPFAEGGTSARETVAGMINPAFWSEEMAPLLDHRAHVRVSEIDPQAAGSEPEDLFDRAVAVTVAAAAVAKLVDAPAVIWLTSRNLLTRRTFGQEMERLHDGAAPLRLWLRWHVVPVAPDEDLQPGVATHGLAELAGFEMIAPPSKVPREAMLEHVFHLASRIVDQQDLPSEGEETGANGETVRLRYAPEGEFSDTRCLVISPGG